MSDGKINERQTKIKQAEYLGLKIMRPHDESEMADRSKSADF